MQNHFFDPIDDTDVDTCRHCDAPLEDDDTNHRYIVVSQTANGCPHEVTPGIYEVLRMSFYAPALLGPGVLFSRDLRLLEPLTEDPFAESTLGDICKACALDAAHGWRHWGVGAP